MVRPREIVTPGLCIIAAAVLIVALFDRPAPLPPGAANYKAAPLIPGTQRTVPPLTFAVDTVETDGTQHPVGDLTPVSPRTPITLHGWAVEQNTVAPAKRLLISVDHAAAVPVKGYGLARPDVGAAIGATATNSGFAAVVPVAHLHPGRHVVHLTLEAANGSRFVLPEPVPFVLDQVPAKGPS